MQLYGQLQKLNKMGVKKKKTQTNNECHSWPVALKHDLFASGQVALSKMMGKKKNSGDKGDKLSLSTSYSCMGHEEVTNGSTEMCLQQSDKLHYLSTMDIKDKRLARWSLININVWNNISKKHEEHIKPMIDY